MTLTKFLLSRFRRYAPRMATVLLLVGLTASLAQGQQTPLTTFIEVDTLTGAPKQSLPFDQPFVLRVPLGKTTGVSSIHLVRHLGSYDLSQTIQYRIQENYEKYRKDSTNAAALGKTLSLIPYKLEGRLDNRFFSEKLEGKGKNFLHIRVKNEFLLDPGKRYSIILSTKPGPAVLNLFDLQHRYTTEPDPVKKAAILNRLIRANDQLAEAIFERLGIYWNISPNRLGGLNKIQKLYTDSVAVSAGFRTIYQRIDTLNTAAGQANLDASFRGKSSLTNFGTLIVTWDPSMDKDYKNTHVATATQMRTINTLFTLDQATYRSIIQGLLPLSNPNAEETDDTDYEARLSNLTATLEQLDALYSAAFLLNAKYAAQLTDAESTGSVPLYQKLNNLRTEIRKIYQAKLQSVVKDQGKISKVIGSTNKFDDAQLVESDSYILSFETRSKLSIVPDVGIAIPVFVKSENQLDYKFVPYLGFQLNLRPINKDLPFWSYRHRFSHFPTFHFGYSLVSVARDGRRVNFFEKSAFLTGVGIRLGNAVKVIGGGLWHFRVQPGQSELKFAALPYVGLSLDLDIKQFLGDFVKDVFPGVSKSRVPVQPVP